MNSTYGQFRRGYGQSEAEQASKLVQCRPGAQPGQIICTTVGPDGKPAGAAPVYDAVKYGRWGRWGGWLGRWGAAVSSSSSSKTTSSAPVTSTVFSPSSSYSTTMTSPSYSTTMSAPAAAASSYVAPAYSTANTILPSVSSSGTVVQTTGSGDAPYIAPTTSSSSSSSYVNPSSSSMWNPGGWGPMQAEGQLTVREGEDSPGGYDEDDDDDGDGGGGDDDSGFPNERQQKRRPGRGYPANKRKRRRNRRRHHSYSGFWGATVDPWWGTKMRYSDKRGSGGYVYRQYVNGDIHIIDAPASITDVFWPAPVGGKAPSRQWAAITKEIGATSPTYAAIASSYSSKKSAKSQASQVPSSVVVTGQKNHFVDNLFAALGQGSAADGKKLVAQAAIAHGPDVAESASEFLQERNSSPAVIQKKIDRLKVKLAAAKAKHDTVKVRKLQAKIKGLQARLLAAQADVEGLDETTLPTATFPWKYVLGGVGLVFALGLTAKLARG